MTRKTTLISTSVLLVLLLLGVSCGSTDSLTESALISDASGDSSYGDSMEEASFATNDQSFDDADPPMEAQAEPSSRATAVSATGTAANEAAAQLPDTGREIVYTADIALGSSDVTTTTRDAIRAVEIRGGFLFSQDTAGGANGYSTLVFKVPPDQFQNVLNELGSVGSVRSQSVSAEDVTAVVVDLESRINTSQASVVRLRALLDGATDIDVIAELENQLLERETSLEQLRGRLRTVQRQVDFATITVRVTELLNHPAMTLEVASYASHDGGFTCQDRPRTTTVDTGTAFTLCWLVTNVGDTTLVDIGVTDPAIASLEADLLVVEGDATNLAPGETVVVAYEFETGDSMRIRSRADATPVALDGTTVDESITAISRNFRLDVVEPSGGLPGFGDVLGNSWNALKVAAIVLALVLVAIAPFLAIALPVGWLLMVALRRRKQAAPPAPAVRQPNSPPPPPTRDDELTSVE